MPGTTKINGPALRVIRERTGVTVAQLVHTLGESGIKVHADHIRNIELGNRQPSSPLLLAIASALRVPLVALLADPAAQDAA